MHNERQHSAPSCGAGWNGVVWRPVVVAGLMALVLPFVAPPRLEAQTAAAPPHWDVMLGAGIIAGPTHAGSDETRVLPLPIVQVTYRERVYAGPISGGVGAGLGVHLVRTAVMGFAAEVGVLEDRPAGRAAVLAGMANRDVLVTAGAAVSSRLGPLAARLGVLHGLNDGGGLLGNAQVSYTHVVGGRLIATLGGDVTAADARQLRREFGVTEAEAVRRADLIAAGDARLRPGEARPYRPGGAVSQAGASASAVYLLTRHWAVTGFGNVSRLGDDAAASPLVRRRRQVAGGLAGVWRP